MKYSFQDIRLGDHVLREGYERTWMVTGTKLGLGDETEINSVENENSRCVKTDTLTVVARPVWITPDRIEALRLSSHTRDSSDADHERAEIMGEIHCEAIS